MLGTRYEEYAVFEGNLPFSFQKGITVTDKAYSPEANWHDNPEIQFCREGSGFVMTDESHLPFMENDIVVINSNVLHHTNTDKRIVYDCLIIDTAFCRQIGIDPLYVEFAPKPQNTHLKEVFNSIADLYESNDKCKIPKLCKLVLEILIELKENYTLSENNNTVKRLESDAIKETIKYIRLNYDRKLSLSEISKNVAMDKYSLSREFKKLTGKTIVNYINSYRSKKASELISEGFLISEAARICGFTNMSFFTKTFKNHMGKYPSQYKK